MIIPGLVSVSFRQKSPLEIVKLCNQANLRAIEWGGDVHVPPKDANAREVRQMTEDHGLTISSYGSYYRVTQPMDSLLACLDTAQELGTDVIRIWCGVKGSEDAESERGQIVDSLLACCEKAKERKLTLSLEYHGKTLTDARESVIRLMKETESVSDTLKFYWQPRFDWTQKECLLSLDDVRPRLNHLHVFTWLFEGKNITRLPLETGETLWTNVLSSFKDDHFALMEFVENDSDEALLRDAAVLNRWINQ